jgi:hypothetical protein
MSLDISPTLVRHHVGRAAEELEFDSRQKQDIVLFSAEARQTVQPTQTHI